MDQSRPVLVVSSRKLHFLAPVFAAVLLIAATTSFGQEAPLPSAYMPMAGGFRFNSNEPQMVPDYSEQSRLKFQVPQWMQQFLSFPSPDEIKRVVGDSPPDVRKRGMEAIRQVLSPQFVPESFQAHLVPMARWAVLYEDWINHGGTDVFVTKCMVDHYTLEVAETHNHVIVLVRDLDNSRATDFGQMLKLTYRYTGLVFSEHVKPVSLQSLKLFRTSLSPPYVYGWYNPKMQALLSGDMASSDLMTSAGLPNEASTSAKATAVRFFCNGDFAAFMVLKPIFGGELKNPFEARFRTAAKEAGREVPFWERPSSTDVTEDRLARKQVEEYLGNYFYDEEGNKLSQRIPIRELEKAFRELSREQQLAIVQRKMIDEFYTSGTKAFAAGDYTSALIYWTNILNSNFDPENPRAAILLMMALRQKITVDYGGNADRAREDATVKAAQDAISRQQTAMALKKQEDQQQVVKQQAVVNFRTRALNFLSEGNYAESLNEWNNLLNVDPGNASALTFRDICEQKLSAKKR